MPLHRECDGLIETGLDHAVIAGCGWCRCPPLPRGIGSNAEDIFGIFRDVTVTGTLSLTVWVEEALK